MPITIEAKICCEVKDCTATEPVTLSLGTMGGLGEVLPDGWQRRGKLRCPEHRRDGVDLSTVRGTDDD